MVLLVFSLVLGIFSTSFAEKNNFEKESRYAKAFLKLMGFGDRVLISPIPLNNVYGRLEAVSFSIDGSGYLIIDINDFDIPEFSLEAPNPFSSESEMIYNGPFNYLKKENGKMTEIKSKRIVDKVVNNYNRPFVDKDKKLEKVENDAKLVVPNTVSSTLIEYGSLRGTLPTWSTDHYCGVDGCAIVLQYYDDNWSDTFVPSDKESANGLTDYLISGNYIIDAPASGPDLVNGISGTTGLQDYNNDRGLSYWYATTGDYSWSSLMDKIDYNRPPLVGANSNHPDFGAHWIIAHGYSQGYDGVCWIICNNGFGSNNVYTTANYIYYTWGLVWIW